MNLVHVCGKCGSCGLSCYFIRLLLHRQIEVDGDLICHVVCLLVSGIDSQSTAHKVGVLATPNLKPCTAVWN